MPNTPNKNLPYPIPTDKAKVPLHIQQLAEAVDVLPAPAKAWVTGDTKISAQTATHADPQGGTWYLANGSAIPAGETALIALLGPNLPDAPGRIPVIKGTHADVNAIGKSDGVAANSRRPAHKHSVATAYTNGNVYVGGSNAAPPGGYGAQYQTPINLSVTVGPQTGAEPTDNPAYIVAGNLFYHS